MKTIYGEPVRNLDTAIVVSSREAARLVEAGKDKKCTCLTCNTSLEDHHRV